MTSCIGALPTTVVAELFGSERLASLLGLKELSIGTFSTALPPIVGALIDRYTGAGVADRVVYRIPLYLNAAFVLLGMLLLIAVWWMFRGREAAKRNDKLPQSKKEDDEDDDGDDELNRSLYPEGSQALG